MDNFFLNLDIQKVALKKSGIIISWDFEYFELYEDYQKTW